MACYHPLKAYMVINQKTEKGKNVIVFNLKEVTHPDPIIKEINLPCKQCIGCRIDRTQEWAIRCIHEKSMFEANAFVTLTYRNETIPPGGSLNVADFQKFMKRLRKRCKGKEPVRHLGETTWPIRFFHCGEYGEQLGRPHHHACLFNYDFDDKVLWSERDGVRLYRSRELEILWPFGHSTTGAVTMESAAYVARYITKKISGDRAKSHYTTINEQTGEITELKPEYVTMSRRPGIGWRWFDQYRGDVYPKDFITFAGKKFKTPSYYDRIYDDTNTSEMEVVKAKRVKEMAKHADNNTRQRLKARESCQVARSKQQIRSMENGIEDV